MFRSVGKIIYDPHRGNMKRRTGWWCIVDVDREISRYYRYWAQKRYNPFGVADWKLHPPAWDAHVSIIRGERPPQDKMDLWKKYHGKKVEIQYPDVDEIYIAGATHHHDATGLFFLVDVKCPELLDIRREFGFKSDWNLHLTFGRMYD